MANVTSNPAIESDATETADGGSGASVGGLWTPRVHRDFDRTRDHLLNRGKSPTAANYIAGAWTGLKIAGSLKLTVMLFALSLVLVLVGTLAQDELNMVAVKHRYFVTWIADLHFDDFFPQAFYPHEDPIPWRIPFTGGKLLGVLFVVNLLAAKITRWRVSAKGSQLAAGVAFLVAGLALTLWVILAGHNGEGVQGEPPYQNYAALWYGVLASAVAVDIAAAYAAFKTDNTLLKVILTAGAAGVGYWLWQSITGERVDDSGLRIVWQLIKGLGAGAILLVGCLMVFGRQGGNLLLHFGVGLLMVGQFQFGDRQTEQRLSLVEGQTTNTTVNLDQFELAFIRHDDGVDVVTAIPSQRLAEAEASGRRIVDDALPVDVRVDAFFENSNLVPAAKDPDLATTGLGLRERSVEIETNGGADPLPNVPAAYVTLYPKGGDDPIGTYMVNQLLSDQAQLIPQGKDELDTVAIGDQSYDIGLRFHREVKPYWVHLDDVKRTNYSGTETPRDYSSHIRIVDPETDEDRKEKVWMNNPLRYRGETFYQSSYQKLRGGGEWTGIQVVANSGWLIPYVACSITALGMLVHFSMTLLRFASRRQRETRKSGEAVSVTIAGMQVDAEIRSAGPPRPSPRKGVAMLRENRLAILTGVLTTLLVVMLAVPWRAAIHQMRPTSRLQSFDFYTAGKIPVSSGGRMMPLDAFARQTLKTISNRESINVDDHTPAGIVSRSDGRRVTAMQWLMEVATKSSDLPRLRMFRIDADEVLEEFDLPRRKSKLYSLDELGPRMAELNPTFDKIIKMDKSQRSFKQRKLLKLRSRTGNFQMAASSFQVPVPDELTAEQSARLFPDLPPLSPSQRQRFAVFKLERILENLRSDAPGVIAPTPSAVRAAGESTEPDWTAFSVGFYDHVNASLSGGEDAAPAGMLTFFEMLRAFDEDNREPAEFNQAVDEHLAAVGEYEIPGYHSDRVSLERWMVHSSPTTIALVVYLLGLVGALVHMVVGSPKWGAAVMTMLTIAFVVHSLSLWCRMEVTDRWPVINLYSSAVFIGWGGVLAGLSVEWIFRYGVGNLLAAFAGVGSLLVAYGLTFTTTDTMPVLEAVLDTQFWLATHVICVTLGYVATLVSGLFGLFWVGTNWFRRGKTELKDVVYRSAYGAACFGILFSFIGTVLGGLWADDSWGRFWGWDPKENGALLIVIWNALMLHARWDKMVGPRGFALLAIGGNIVTAWSWFGTNELGIGLHSYGFTEGVLMYLSLFVGTQLAVIGIDSMLRFFETPKASPVVAEA